MSDTMPGTGQCWGEQRKLCAAASVATLPVLASSRRYLIRYLRRQARNLRCDSSMPLPAVRCGCRPHDDSSLSAKLASSLAPDVPSASAPAALVNCIGSIHEIFQPVRIHANSERYNPFENLLAAQQAIMSHILNPHMQTLSSSTVLQLNSNVLAWNGLGYYLIVLMLAGLGGHLQDMCM